MLQDGIECFIANGQGVKYDENVIWSGPGIPAGIEKICTIEATRLAGYSVVVKLHPSFSTSAANVLEVHLNTAPALFYRFTTVELPVVGNESVEIYRVSSSPTLLQHEGQAVPHFENLTFRAHQNADDGWFHGSTTIKVCRKHRSKVERVQGPAAFGTIALRWPDSLDITYVFRYKFRDIDEADANARDIARLNEVKVEEDADEDERSQRGQQPESASKLGSKRFASPDVVDTPSQKKKKA